jgi:hypothetical protein
MADSKHITRLHDEPLGRRLRATLDLLAAVSSEVDGVGRATVGWGDRIEVATRNSVYRLWCVGENRFVVTGGWFDRRGAARDRGRTEIAVNGCTWGGSAIRADLVAAPGFFLEFANGVRTTRIRSVLHVRTDWSALPVH